ncbi:NusA-like transcription termination signal-binding factor [Candidatus Micrarchaeota archaeon]|nr:NusA-like transcription termination signal-binding factor [Candidatus Micrarchaeota archaeon]
MEFTGDELQLFDLFTKLSGVDALDLEKTPYGLVFLVAPQNLGRAIGKQGATLERMRRGFKQGVFVYADSSDLDEFVRNLFNNVKIENVEVREAMGERAVFLTVDDKDRGIAIGKEGARIKIAKQLLKRKFNSTISIKTRRAVI